MARVNRNRITRDFIRRTFIRRTLKLNRMYLKNKDNIIKAVNRDMESLKSTNQYKEIEEYLFTGDISNIELPVNFVTLDAEKIKKSDKKEIWFLNRNIKKESEDYFNENMTCDALCSYGRFAYKDKYILPMAMILVTPESNLKECLPHETMHGMHFILSYYKWLNAPVSNREHSHVDYVSREMLGTEAIAYVYTFKHRKKTTERNIKKMSRIILKLFHKREVQDYSVIDSRFIRAFRYAK